MKPKRLRSVDKARFECGIRFREKNQKKVFKYLFWCEWVDFVNWMLKYLIQQRSNGQSLCADICIGIMFGMVNIIFIIHDFYLFIFLFIYLFTYIFIYLIIYLFIYLFIYLCIYLAFTRIIDSNYFFRFL